MRRTYPSRSAAGDAVRLVVGVVALFGGTWLLGWLLVRSGWGGPVLRLDRHVATWVPAHRTAWLTRLMHDWTRLGTRTVLVPLVIGAGLLFRWRARTWVPFVMMAVTSLGLPVLYNPIKELLERPRPHAPPIVATEPSWAFPSGHSTQAVAMASLLAWLLLQRLEQTWARRAVVAVALVLALGVMSSRIELGVHWTTDVLAGALLGGLWTATLVRTRGAQRALTMKSAAPRK